MSENYILTNNNKPNQLIEKAYDILKESYKSAIKRTYIEDIINGENIEIKPDNILIDDITEKQIDDAFGKKCACCTKKLYDYQRKAILTMRKLEMDGFRIEPSTGKKLVSNAWILSLPIGSGKSLCFIFLSLFYRYIDPDTHPIIISKTGQHLPINEPMKWVYYPFYYEQPCYYDTKDTKNEQAVVVYKNYKQHKMTIVLTHSHLMAQMEAYIKTDFPTIFNSPKTKIVFAEDASKFDYTADIMFVTAKPSNIKELVKESFQMPFMRVIIDDYTSICDIEEFREILASSTMFISGSGYDRENKDIPVSYYTLKFAPTQSLSIVGKPEDTYTGIVRNNILTFKLMGSSCEFSSYEFLQKLEEIVQSSYSVSPVDVYPIIKTEPLIKNFLALMFVIQNKDRIRSAIQNLDRDYNFTNTHHDCQHKYKNTDIEYFLKWKKMLESDRINPLYKDLFVDKSPCGSRDPSPIVSQQCMCCRKETVEHNNYGIISTCCGAFYCENCINSATTRAISDTKSNRLLYDNKNYYCCCCRSINPTFYINITKKKDKNVFAYTLIDEYFDTTNLKKHIKFDYYYYMMQHGLVPKKSVGPAIDISNEIEQKLIDPKCFTTKIIPEFQHIYSIDHLLIKSISNMEMALHKLNISIIKYNPVIIVYGCPDYIVQRLRSHVTDICRRNPKSILKYITLSFHNSLNTIIGLHINVLGIILWKKIKNKDEFNQILGRQLRINIFELPIRFFIESDVISV